VQQFGNNYSICYFIVFLTYVMYCNIFRIYSFAFKQLISTFYLAITSYVKSPLIQTLSSHFFILWNTHNVMSSLLPCMKHS